MSTAAPAVAWDRPNTTADRMGALMAAFAHHLDGAGKPAGVFEKGSDPIIVGQAAYNTALGTSFVANGYCNSATTPSAKCDGFARIAEGAQPTDRFKFDTVSGSRLQLAFQPKGMHDEMNSASFDEWGRMTANMGLEAPGATPLLQNIILYPYVNPATEILDAGGMPSALNVTPISSAADGTQLWKITHNGVDTHPIHFHLYDVQVINRVTWDNIIIPPEPSELGWKDTVRVSPLEDTIVALRPIVPSLPFGVPDSSRPLNPMMPIGATGDLNTALGTQAGFNNTNTDGTPMVTPIVNVVTDFKWEYVFHCHILSHEEMDMMRPVTVTTYPVTPGAPTGVAAGAGSPNVTVTWTDPTPVNMSLAASTIGNWGNMANEIGFKIERAPFTNHAVGSWAQVGTAVANATTFIDTTAASGAYYLYRVIAYNQAGSATSAQVTNVPAPATPASVTATASAVWPLTVTVGWTGSVGASSYTVVRTGGTGGTVTTTVAGTATQFVDTSVVKSTAYSYTVTATGPAGTSATSSPAATVTTPNTALVQATGLAAANTGPPMGVALTWTGQAWATGYQIQRATNSAFTAGLTTIDAGLVTAYTNTPVTANTTYYYRIRAYQPASVFGAYSATVSVLTPSLPGAPTGVTAAVTGDRQLTVTWTAPASTGGSAIISYEVQQTINTSGTWTSLGTVTSTSKVVTGLTAAVNYGFRVRATTIAGTGPFSATSALVMAATTPSAPTNVTATRGATGSAAATIGWTAPPNSGSPLLTYTVQRSFDNGVTWSGYTAFAAPANSFLATGLTVGRTYVFRVRATNAVGIGVFSANTAPIVAR